MINDDIHDHKKQSNEHLYLIRVLGELDQARNAWFAEIGFESVADQEGTTTLKGMIKDQAHLRGILNRIWDMNFTVALVKRLEETGDNQ